MHVHYPFLQTTNRLPNQMNPRWPSRCITVSSIYTRSNVAFRIALLFQSGHVRHYAQQPAVKYRTPAPTPATNGTGYSSRAALDAIELGRISDPVNPPRSVLPPPLDLPQRGSENFFIYLYRYYPLQPRIRRVLIDSESQAWESVRQLLQKLHLRGVL